MHWKEALNSIKMLHLTGWSCRLSGVHRSLLPAVRKRQVAETHYISKKQKEVVIKKQTKVFV